MPELPEVETVRRGLAPVMEGAVIARAILNRPDLRFPFPVDLAARLQGRRIAGLGRRAKYLLLHLDAAMEAPPEVLIAHLGMSGAFRVESGIAPSGGQYHPKGKNPAHDHVILDLEGGARILYNDPRRFGFMTLVASADLETHPFLSGLGPEPTGNALSAQGLATALLGKARPIKTALLDQGLIAGLGNIYVCEALHRAHIAPERPCGTLVDATGAPSAALSDLVAAIRAVIAEAIEAGGSSLRDHRQADGSLGYFQHAFRVYDRAGEACSTPGCAGIIARKVQSGRSTFYCPCCQH